MVEFLPVKALHLARRAANPMQRRMLYQSSSGQVSEDCEWKSGISTKRTAYYATEISPAGAGQTTRDYLGACESIKFVKARNSGWRGEDSFRRRPGSGARIAACFVSVLGNLLWQGGIAA
jgi:hypothetical protein